MDKRRGGGRKAVLSGGGGQGLQSQGMEGDLAGAHLENRRRSGRCEGSGSESSAVTQVRKQKEEVELKRHLQLKEMKAVVVLTRLTAEETEALLGKKKNIQPVSALKVLPPEILTMILDHLKDPTDLRNCSRADPRLSSVLTPRMPVYLFDQVLPHLLGYLSFDDVKSCRLVCQEWKRSVNQLIDNRPSVDPYDDKNFLEEMGKPRTRLNYGITPHSRLQPVTRLKADIASLEVFSACYNSLSFAGRSPFLGGALELLVAPEGDNHFPNADFVVEFLVMHFHALKEFLQIFGGHLHHISFNSPQTASLVQKGFFNFALDCCSFCPNLRTLSIQISHDGDLLDIPVFDDQPLLPHLHTIEISTPPGIRISHGFINAVVTPYLSQLQKLSLPPSATPTWFPIQNGPLILKELQLDIVSSHEDLERLSRINSPVEKLILQLGFPAVNLPTLLKALSRFSLRHLELSWTPGVSPFIRGRCSIHDVLPEIPSVHTLTMTNSVDVNYSFLRSFPNLKHLYLHEQVPRNGVPLDSTPSKAVMKRIAGSEAVQVHKYLYGGQMNRSYIWAIFPNLKVIVFERVREGEEAEKLKLNWERRPVRGRPISDK